MQKRQGYCSYCRVQYSNLEQQTPTKGKTKRSSSGRRKMIPDGTSEIQEVMKNNGKHLFSAQHRSSTRQSRNRICSSGLMERFLQDVLRHHPYNYQDTRSAQNEAPANPGSPDVVVVDEFRPEERDEETESEELYSDESDPAEDLQCGPSQSQECAHGFSARPSVIQKLEMGQQQSLAFAHKIESGMRKINPVEIGQPTNNGKKLIRPPVICNVSASYLPKSSYDRPLSAKTTRLALAVSSESFGQSDDTNKFDQYFGELDGASSSPMSSNTQENPKETNKQTVCIDIDKLLSQRNVRARGETSTPVYEFRELTDNESSPEAEFAASSVVGLNKPNMPSDEEISEDAIPEHFEESLSSMNYNQEERKLVFNKPEALKEECSVSSEDQVDLGSLQPISDQSQDAEKGLELSKEEESGQEDENSESRGSQMSFDCGSSCHSLTALSEVTAREVNLSEKIPANLQDENNKSVISETASDDDRADSVQVVTSQSQVTAEEVSPQNKKRVSLVDECYDSSGSEMNFDCGGNSLQTINEYSQNSVPEVRLPNKARIQLVDLSYGSTSSDESNDLSLEKPPVVATEVKRRKKARISLVDESYGSSNSESSDSDTSQDHLEMTVKGRNLKAKPVVLKNKKRKPTSANAHLETVDDEPQRDVEEINLLKKKNAGLVDMNCESHGPGMGFHADAQLVADQSQVAVKEVNPQKVDIGLEIKRIQYRIANLSIESHDNNYQSANDQPEGALGEVNLKELNVDMEVKSNGCSSSELTFDSDSPLLSVTERSQLDFERLKEDGINLEDESCESSSSDVTFDSDIPNCSVIDQLDEEEPVDLENKSNESCISEITFDSGIPLHSGNDLPEVAVGVIIQNEEYVHLARKNDTPIDCEINLDSHAPLHSVTNPPELYVKKLNSHKEEQVHVENKKNEPADSALNLNYDFFNLMPGHSEDPIKDINFQKNRNIYLGTKSNECVSETRLGSDTLYPTVICKPQVLVENPWLQKEKHAELQHNSADLYHSEINLDSDVPHYPRTESQGAGKKAKRKTKHILESDKLGASEITLNSNVLPQLVTEKPQLAVLKESHVDPEDESTDIRGFEINSNIDTCLHSVLDQTQQTFSKEKEEVKKHSTNSEHRKMATQIKLWQEDTGLENETDEPKGSKEIHVSDVSFPSISSQPDITIKQINLENKDQVYLETKNRQYSLASDIPSQSVMDQPKVTILEPKHIELQGEDSQSFGSEASFESDDSLQSMAVQLSEGSRDSDFWMDEDVDLESKRDEAKGFKIIYDSLVLRSVASQTDVVQETNCRQERVDLEDKVVQPNDSKINFDPNGILQSVTDKIEETIKEANLLRETHIRLGDQSFDPGSSGAINLSHIPFWSVIRPPQILQEEHSSLEVRSSDPRDPEICSDASDPCCSVTCQAEVVQENSHCKEHVDLEDKTVQPSDSKINSDSDELLQSVTNKIQEPIKEVHLRKGPAAHLDDKGYEPHGSGAIYASKILYCSVIQPLQILQKEHSSLEVKSSDPCGPDSSDPCHSMAGQAEVLQETSNWKEHGDLEDKTVRPSDSEANLDSDEPLQSVTNTIQEPIQERNIKERSICLDDKGYEQHGSRITFISNIPFCSVIQPPQILQGDHSSLEVGSSDSCGPEVSSDSSDPCHSVGGQTEIVQDNSHWKECVDLEDQIIEPGGSKINTDSDNLQSVTNELQEPLQERNHLKERHVYLDDNSSEPGGSGIIHFSNTPSCLVIQPPQILQEENSSLEVKSSDPCGPEISFESSHAFHSVIGQTEAVPEANHWKERTDLKDNVIEPGGSKINSDSEKPLQPATDKIQEPITEVDHLKEGYASLDDKDCEPGTSGIIHVSHIPFCSVIQPPQILQEEHSSLEIGSDDPCGPEESSDSSDPCYSLAEQTELAQKTSQEDKTVQPSNSDSDELLQSVTNEIQAPIKDLNLLRKGHSHLDDNGCEPCASGAIYASDTPIHSVIEPSQILPEGHSSLELGSNDPCGPEVSSDSTDPCHSVTEQIEVFQETSHWEEHVDLEDKTVQPSDSGMSADSDELLSLTNEIQEPIEEVNILSDNMGYEPEGSEVFHVSNNPLHSAIQPSQSLQVEHSSLEDKSSDPCCPIISFDSSDPCHSEVGQLHNAVKEINLKEDHIYLEDKSYRLVDVEASCDSDIPVQIVVDQSVEDMSVKEINLEKKDHNDLENENSSEIRYDSDLHQQTELDPPQVVCQETGLQKKELGMEEKSSEASDSEMMYDSDVSFQIVVNQGQTSDGETDSPQVVIVDVAANDSDCDREVISDANTPLEVVNEPPQMTSSQTSSTDSPVVGSLKCDFCGFEVKYDPATFFQSATNQSKKSFRIINRNNDYIILGDSTCQSCGCELNFNVASKSVTFQPQGPDQSRVDSEDKSRESNDPKRDFNLGDSSQAVNNQLQKTDTEDNVWGDEINAGMKDSDSAADDALSTVAVVQHAVSNDDPSMSERSDLKSVSGSEKDFRGDLSLQPNPGKHQESVKKTRRRKRAAFDRRADNDSQSSCVPKLPVKNRKKVAFNQRENTHESQSRSASVDYQSSYVPQVGSGKGRKKITFHLRENSCGSQSSCVPQVESRKSQKTVSLDLRENTHYFYPGSTPIDCQPSYAPKVGSGKSRKKVTFDLREKTRYFHPGSAPIDCQSSRVPPRKRQKKITFKLRETDSPSCSSSGVDSVRDVGRDVVEENPNEPVLEALPHVPPSFVGKTWSQIMKEDDIKINTLVKEFKEGRFRCYFDDNSETNEVFLNEEERNTWPGFNQDTVPVQAQLDHENVEGRIAENDGVSEALDKSHHHSSLAEKPHKQSENVASQSQTEKVSHGMEINYKNYPLKKRKINRPEEESPKRMHLQSDNVEEKKPKSRAFVFPTLEFKVVEPNSLICVSSANTKRMEDESFNSTKTNQYSYDTAYKQNDPLLKKTARKTTVPNSGRPKRANAGLKKRDVSTSTRKRGKTRNLASTTVPARYELRSRYRTTKSATLQGNPEDASASGVLNDSNCQPTPLSPDVPQMASKPVRNEFCDSKSKKKVPKGKMITDDKSHFGKSASEAVILRQKFRLASAKLSIRVQMKANYVIRKYLLKYSVFIRRRFQRRGNALGTYLKKKLTVASRVKDVKRATEMFLSSSLLPIAVGKRLRAISGLSPKKSMRHPSTVSARKKYKKKYHRRKKSAPIREYDLRSSGSVPNVVRMVTRLTSKLRSNEW
ncbi:LOW QUALITY PROTEIN: DBF4-type zinc finger-containing protein 2 [Dipodomys merriami]|uniref:LOW QUALITY PROTEIN: DBF4-type zinc finger-containing protein 2 n=1 Tax=Dipodomys merriami TaxID=94247 RepID=UPI00384A834F